jgi:hypothetical protein
MIGADIVGVRGVTTGVKVGYTGYTGTNGLAVESGLLGCSYACID